MFQNPLQEINVNKAINVNKVDDTAISWQNSSFTVRTSKGIHIYEFTYNLTCMDKKLDFKESLIQTPKSSPATYLCSNNFITLGVNNFELSQLIIDPSLWPHNPQIVQEMACVIDCKWSPNDFLYNGEPLLAVLNNIGNVDLFGKINGDWENLLDLSSCVNQEMKLVLPKYVDDLKKKADIVESSAVCWAPTPNSSSCCLVLGQKNGDLLIWRLSVDDTELNAHYYGCLCGDGHEVKSILCIDKTEGNFTFIVANILGQIIVYDCRENKNVEKVHNHYIWPHKDKMVTHHIHYALVNSMTVIFFDKHRHFVAQMLDKNYQVISQYAEIINDYKISTVTGNLDEFFVGTINFKMYKIKFSVTNDCLDVRLDLIETKEAYNNCELFGMSFSKNKQILALVLLDRSVFARKMTPYVNLVFLDTNPGDDSILSYLLSNNEKNMYNLWDCIELLRYKIMKSKMLPSIDLDKLITDGNTDIFKLKLYLAIAIMWHTLGSNLKVPRQSLPKGVDETKEIIMFKHAQAQLVEMHKLYLKNKSLGSFEMEVFFATKQYLKYFSSKYGTKLEEIVSPDIFNIIKCERKYICQCCNDELKWFSCKSGHINMFCPVTFLPIETDDYLICDICKITARVELYEKHTRCLFCDRYLQKYFLS